MQVNKMLAWGLFLILSLSLSTVDVSLSQVDGQVWADTQVWLRLTNPAANTVAVVLALPGPVNANFGKGHLDNPAGRHQVERRRRAAGIPAG